MTKSVQFKQTCQVYCVSERSHEQIDDTWYNHGDFRAFKKETKRLVSMEQTDETGKSQVAPGLERYLTDSKLKRRKHDRIRNASDLVLEEQYRMADNPNRSLIIAKRYATISKSCHAEARERATTWAEEVRLDYEKEFKVARNEQSMRSVIPNKRIIAFSHNYTARTATACLQ